MHLMWTSAIGVMLSIAAPAQTPITRTEVVTSVDTVQAIDTANRIITLRDESGNEDRYYVPRDVARFDAIKVGDKLNARYHESYVVKVRKPGQAAPSPGSAMPEMTKTPGAKPGGTMARQMTATVQVVSVDPAVPSITVKTPDGRTVVRKIEDKSRLEGVNPGDQIDITYTQAVIVSFEPAK
ncbi:MAG TPA: hypothetical protein VL484_13515 [Vicinamibacterales bacterium]|jgi:hypothetical protein|nr:hypothetical protein [Vicinamibacterales bacterium]